MASDAYNNNKDKKVGDDKPKRFVKMLTFRVVPSYFNEIEKVANHKKMTVSKLIRSYIKEGMKRDGELSKSEENAFLVGD